MPTLKFTPVPKAKAEVAAPNGQPNSETAPLTKIAQITQLLRRPEGADITELMTVTGWQAHSVRGALSGAIKAKLKLNVVSEKTEGARLYRIVEEAAA